MRAPDRLTRRRVTPVRLVPVVLAAALAVVAMDRLAEPSAPTAGPPLRQAAGAAGAAGYDVLADSYASGIDAARERAAGRPGEWLVQEQYARALLARGRLSGSFDDYAMAQQVLDRALSDAPAGAGPHLALANLHLLMHRLAGAEAMLGAIGRYAVPPDAGEQAEIAGMRGDIAFYRGDYSGAWRFYGDADRLQPGSADFRRAIFYSKTGRSDLAERQFDSYERNLARPSRQLRANLQLQRGILDLESGRYSDALDHFNRADAIFPGWWLVEEHIAETTALLGDQPGAERRYRRVIARTGAPEFMDALAALLLARGADAEAHQLRRRSRALWERRLGQFPEASFGHALDHCAGFGDRDCALRLARRNYEARPYGEAGEQLVAALADAGRLDEARQAIDRILRSPWRTADLFATAHRIYLAQGDHPAAARWRRNALALNPRIFG